MKNKLKILKRHTWHLSLYAFFLVPLLSQTYIEPIIISIDPIGNTAYYLDPYLPKFQRNLYVYDLRINGVLELPLSTFVFDVEESPVILFDSLRTRSTFHFIKGDYGFRDLSVKTQTLTLNGGTLTGFAHTRSYNGSNGRIGDGSLMQNYLLNYRNNFKNSKFSITTAYHIEDMNLPISDDENMAKINESYFTGLTFNTKTHIGQFSYHSDLQVSEIFNIDSVKWISNQSAAFKFNQYDRFTPFLKWSENGENQQFYRGGFTFGDSITYVSLNLAYINTTPQMEMKFGTEFRNTYIQIERKILDDYTVHSQNYILNSLIIGAEKNRFYVQLGPSVVTDKENSYNLYFGGFGFNGEVVMFNMECKFYNKKTWPLRRIISSDLKINFPYFERYTPFFNTEYNYYSRNSVYNGFMWIEDGKLIENVHRLNIEFGFKLDKFKISYHIRNILDEDGRFINNYEKIPIHKYLKVEWQFRN